MDQNEYLKYFAKKLQEETKKRNERLNEQRHWKRIKDYELLRDLRMGGATGATGI